MVLYVYATTLFVSAFILFLVQPLIGKMILPKLGGTPQVWNTCMVFFQMVLLAGYAYTHFISSGLKLRKQILLHCVLLGLPLIVLFLLPVNFFNLYQSVESGGWSPGNLGGNPILATLGILAIVIGLPFLVVSTTAPLLQKWFAYTGHPAAKDPYFLYGASNLGSLLALVAYPIAIEPALGLSAQTWVWAVGYFALIGTVLACVGLVWAPSARIEVHPHVDLPPPAPAEAPPPPVVEAATSVTSAPPVPKGPTGIRPGVKKGGRGAATTMRAEPTPSIAMPPRDVDAIDGWRRFRWVMLAAVPSSLMLGITTHITTDLSPIPLFWVIPLALYLLTFILVFSRWPLNWVEQAHPYVLYLQPVCICVMLFLDMMPTTEVTSAIRIEGFIGFFMLGFFATTLLCHGELAKDRPSARHLTEFYLWMSVGGMVGGMFNALFAPVVFSWGLIELPIAIFIACLLRPKMKESGWTDDIVAGILEPAPATPSHGRGKTHGRPQPAVAAVTTTPQMSGALDVILPGVVLLLTLAFATFLSGLVGSIAVAMAPRKAASGLALFLTFGVPLAIACFYFARPWRFGLAVGAVMIAHYLYQSQRDHSEYNDRSFFGIISVKQSSQEINGVRRPFNQLLHGSTNHGMNFLPPKQDEIGDPSKDFTRLATTYYHRLGPAGRVMEMYNWFPNSPENVYWADARMPAAITAHAAMDMLSGSLPLGSFVNLWSEPPFATIGLGTGTMASYGRPYQHVHYYEIDNHIRRLSLPKKAFYTYADADSQTGTRYFGYLDGAIRRGSHVQVLMGDARLRMALPYGNFAEFMTDEPKWLREHKNEPAGGPESFYHMMVVDAFSSDAIPAHLITKEAIKMYFTRLSEAGILCVHTSNRYVSLPKVVAAVTLALNEEMSPADKAKGYQFSSLRGHDQAPFEDRIGHFTSEWIMVTRKPEYLSRLKALEPEGYNQALRAMAEKKGARIEDYWNTVNPQRRYLWTDNYYTLWTVLRRAGDED